MNKPVVVKFPNSSTEQEKVEGTIIGTFGKSGKQKVYLKEDFKDLEKLQTGSVELRIKVYSKEIAKLKNKQH